jgi:hypothetical protein
MSLSCPLRPVSRWRLRHSPSKDVLRQYESLTPLPPSLAHWLCLPAEKLSDSIYGAPDDIAYIAECFDKSTKLTFRDPRQPSFIKFGSPRDADPSVDIKFGQLKLHGSVPLPAIVTAVTYHTHTAQT